MSYVTHFSRRVTPQTQPIPMSNQVPNSAGGYAFPVDDWARLDRFLILGNEGGSYYASEQKLTVENAQALIRCADADPARAVKRIVDISDSGRAPKNDPAIFALAVLAGHKKASAHALAELPKVCRIGTHFFQFVEAVEHFRGHGRALNRALQNWYLEKDAKNLAYQAIKYQQRNGWSHRDVLRLCKPKAISGDTNTVFHWITKGWDNVGEMPHEREALQQVWAFEKAKKADVRELCGLIRDYNLPRECVPTQHLTKPEVWEALLEHMPMTAMVRNLGNMSKCGLLAPLSHSVHTVTRMLADADKIKKSKLHPMAILVALKTYAAGHSEKGSGVWTPVPQVIYALDGAFYSAFANVVPTGKRWLLALDVSGSMGYNRCTGAPMMCSEASAALALVTAKVEQNYHIMAFADNFRSLPITANSRLVDAQRQTVQSTFGGTDCSIPFVWAHATKTPVDVFVVITDNETYMGDIHPSQALKQYRYKTGINAKSIIVGMAANGFSIADPNDAGMMDVVGFDAAAPAVMADFARDA